MFGIGFGSFGSGVSSVKNLPGIQSWLKADAGTFTDTGMTTPATTDGATVAGWQDQGGGSNSFTNTGVGTATAPVLKLNIQNGLPVIRWAGASALQNTTLGSVFQSTNPFTIYIAAKQNSAEVKTLMTWVTYNPGLDYGYFIMRNSGTTPNGQTLLRKNSDAGTSDLTDVSSNFAIITLTYAGSTSNTVKTNGNTGTSGTTASNGTTINTVNLGALVRTGANANGTLFFNGDIGEIIVYNQLHTAAQQSFAVNYLATRWAPVPTSANNLTGTGYFESNYLTWSSANNASTYKVERASAGTGNYATPGTGITDINFFDTGLNSNGSYDYRVYGVNAFGVQGPASSLTNITTASGAFTPVKLGPILRWGKPDALGLSNGQNVATNTDQSPTGNNFTQVTSANQPVYETNVQNSLGMIRYNGSAAYMIRDSMSSAFSGNKSVSTFFMCKLANTLGNNDNRNIFIAANSAGSSVPTFDLYYATFSQALIHSDRRDDAGNEYSVGFGNPDMNAHALGMIYDRSNIQLYLDGTTMPPIQHATTPGTMTVNSLTLGAHRRADGVTAYWNGYIGEEIWYPFALNSTQLTNLNNYLLTRWNITQYNNTDPSSISGLKSWYRSEALNPFNTIASGATVGVWYSKNIYNTDVSASGTITWHPSVINSRPVAKSGATSAWFEAVPANVASQISGGGSFTIFGTFRASATSSNQNLFSFTNNTSTTAYQTIGIVSAPAYSVVNQNNASAQASAAGGTPDTNAHSFIYTYDGQDGKLYIDGSITVTASQSSPGTAFTFIRFVMGGLYRGSLTNSFVGDLGECGIYNKALSASEITTIYNYQKAWWNTP